MACRRHKSRLSLFTACLLLVAGGGSVRAFQDPTDRDVADALRRWRTPERSARLGALNRLRELGSRAEPAVPEIARGLSDPDPVIRAKIARLSQAMGDVATAANPALLAAAKDADPKVREAVFAALLRTRPDPKQAIPVLVQAIDREPSSQAILLPLGVLCRMGKPAVPSLIQLMKRSSADRLVSVVQSMHILEESGAPAVPELLAAVDRVGENDPSAFALCLAKFSRGSPETLIEAVNSGNPRIRMCAYRSLEYMSVIAEPVIPALVSALKRDGPPAPTSSSKSVEGDPRRTAWDSRRYGPHIALGNAGRAAVPALLELLDQSDLDQRILAIRTLGYTRQFGRAAVPRLIGLLARPELRLETIHALGRIQPPARAALPMLTLLLKHRDPGVRVEAAWAIGSIGRAGRMNSGRSVVPASTVAGLVAALHDPVARVRQAAIMALGVIDADAAAVIPALIEALAEPSPEFRAGVLSSLAGFANPPESSRSVILSYLKDPDRRVRTAAARALSTHSLSPEMIGALLASLSDPDHGVRAAAAVRLARCHAGAGYWTEERQLLQETENGEALVNAPRAFDTLRALIASPDRRVRSTATILLPHFKDHAAESVPLIADRLTDPGLVVRLNAAMALKELGPAAAPAFGAMERAARNIKGMNHNESDEVGGLSQAMVAVQPGSKDRIVDLLIKRVDDDDRGKSLPAEVALLNFADDVSGRVARELAGGTLSDGARRRLVVILSSSLLNGRLDPAQLNARLAEIRFLEPVLRELTDDEDDEASGIAIRLVRLFEPPARSAAQRALDDVAERGVKPWLVSYDPARPEPAEIEILLKALKSPRAEIRTVAALALQETGSTLPVHFIAADPPAPGGPPAPNLAGQEPATTVRLRILDALIPLASDPDDEVRGAAIRAIGAFLPGAKSRTAACLPLLIGALRDSKTRCRSIDAAWYLQNGLGLDMELLPRITSGSLQAAALIALGSLAEDAADAIPDLIQLSRSDDAVVRWFALQTMGAIGRKAGACVPVLIRLLDELQSSASLAFEVAVRKQFQFKVVTVLGQIGPEARAAIPALTQVLRSRDAELATVASYGLGAISVGSSEAVPALASIVTTSQDLNLPDVAAAALASIGEPALAAIRELLRHRDPDTRLAVISMLGNMEDQDTAITLLLQAQTDADPDVVDAAKLTAERIREAQRQPADKPEGGAIIGDFQF